MGSSRVTEAGLEDITKSPAGRECVVVIVIVCLCLFVCVCGLSGLIVCLCGFVCWDSSG